MAGQRITKRLVDGLKVGPQEYAVWDGQMPSFGVRVRPTGAMSYVVVYRAGAGRGAPFRRLTIGPVGKITPEAARKRARGLLGQVAHGKDPAAERAGERTTPTVAELADRFLKEHVEPKRKPKTTALYRDLLDRIVKPAFGTTKADKVTRSTVAKLHSGLAATPFHANRMLAVVASMYAFASRAGLVPEGTNPAGRVEKFPEHRRERFLTADELERLGAAIREAETVGIPWRCKKSGRHPSTWPTQRSASRRSGRTRPPRSAFYSSPAPGCGRCSTSGGRTSTWSGGCSSCPTARPVGRRWCSTRRPCPSCRSCHVSARM
jgi:Arm DNA-binding domain